MAQGISYQEIIVNKSAETVLRAGPGALPKSGIPWSMPMANAPSDQTGVK